LVLCFACRQVDVEDGAVVVSCRDGAAMFNDRADDREPEATARNGAPRGIRL
jgi:hypothetical protein